MYSITIDYFSACVKWYNRLVDYQRYMTSSTWRKKRLQALEAAGGECSECFRPYGLQVHHITYKRLGHEAPEDLEALCRECHAGKHPNHPSIPKHLKTYELELEKDMDELYIQELKTLHAERYEDRYVPFSRPVEDRIIGMEEWEEFSLRVDMEVLLKAWVRLYKVSDISKLGPQSFCFVSGCRIRANHNSPVCNRHRIRDLTA